MHYIANLILKCWIRNNLLWDWAGFTSCVLYFCLFNAQFWFDAPLQTFKVHLQLLDVSPFNSQILSGLAGGLWRHGIWRWFHNTKETIYILFACWVRIRNLIISHSMKISLKMLQENRYDYEMRRESLVSWLCSDFDWHLQICNSKIKN